MNRVKGTPPICKADHDIVYVEYDIKAKRIKQASRKIYLYKRADMVGLKDHMAQFKDAYLSEDHSHMSVNDMWVKFKTGFVEAVERFIPSKMTKTKYSVRALTNWRFAVLNSHFWCWDSYFSKEAIFFCIVGLPLFGKEGSGTPVFKTLVRALLCAMDRCNDQTACKKET